MGTIETLARKELTTSLPLADAVALADRTYRRRWKEALVQIVQSQAAYRAELCKALEEDLALYAKTSDGKSLILSATKIYDQKIRAAASLGYKAERRLRELDLADVAETPPPDTALWVNAIKAHRDATMLSGREVEDSDIALWATLEGQWLFEVPI